MTDHTSGRTSGHSERVRALLRRVPLIDGHNDLPGAIRKRNFYDFGSCDIAHPQPDLMTDIPRLRAGRVGGQFWSVFVPSTLQGDAAVAATLEQIDAVHAMVRRYPEDLELATSADDVERAFGSGRIASLIGMEGGHSVACSMGTLRMMYTLGARYMTLTHNDNVPWADSATDEAKHDGLTSFGEEIVREMNRLGMLADCSHVAPATMADALRVSEAPVIFSHSSCRALSDHPRDIPDEILRRLPANGGVAMVTFVPEFVSQECADWKNDIDGEVRRRGLDPHDRATWREVRDDWARDHPRPKVTIAQVADHVDHVRDLAGVDHIGIGGDYDGVDVQPEGLQDVSRYPALLAELAGRGYDDDDLAKIAGGNVLRALREAEDVARRLQVAREPSRARIADLDS
ncbi:MAG: dipeptidase [Streptosporangiaceae bacterium]